MCGGPTNNFKMIFEKFNFFLFGLDLAQPFGLGWVETGPVRLSFFCKMYRKKKPREGRDEEAYLG
jgi:hypothetical protein